MMTTPRCLAHRGGLRRRRGLDIFLVHPSAPSSSSSLTPFASSFHPRDGLMGHSKARRWADEDLDDSDVERSPVTSPTSYLNTVHLGSQLQTSPLLERAKPRLIVRGSHGSATTKQGKRPLVEGARPTNVTEGTRFTASGAWHGAWAAQPQGSPATAAPSASARPACSTRRGPRPRPTAPQTSRTGLHSPAHLCSERQ
jgi:hypothetical protein